MPRIIVLGLLVLIGACTSLEPVELPPEYTAPPADAPLWSSLEQARPEGWIVPLNDGPTALEWRLRAIDSATESIDLQTFLWTFDTAGSMVLDRLLAAAERGVVVRLLVDDTYLLGEDDVLVALDAHPRIEFRVFNPYANRSRESASRMLANLNELDRLDHRMHNKSLVVDGRVSIVGGRNLADEYFGTHELANFRDLEALLAGPAVRAVSGSFDDYWNSPWSVPVAMLSDSTGSPLALEEIRSRWDRGLGLYTVEPESERAERWRTLVASAPDGEITFFADNPPEKNPANPESAPVQVANALITLLDGAREEIVIISAYLIPTSDLTSAVARAVDRGVQVRMLTNSVRSNNHLAAHGAYRRHIAGLVADGVAVHEVRADARDRQRYMISPVATKLLGLHAKALLIDHEYAFIGSANMDPRSLRLNTEMGVLVSGREFNAEIRSVIDPDFNPANAWKLQPNGQGGVIWVSARETRTTQPSSSFLQELEDWFFSLLPIEEEL
ncbi:MAG: phospholipase D family protein [Gammaproteobacteria bacterium]